MSRYLLLFLVNLPFIIAAILGAIVSYKLGKLTKRRLIARVALWVVVLASLASADYIYEWLFSNNLTQTEPLSLFDVVQITAIVLSLYLISRLRDRIGLLESRLTGLHRELSIYLSSASGQRPGINRPGNDNGAKLKS